MYPISTCPGYDDEDGEDFVEHPDMLVYIEHFEKPHLNRFVVGHFVEDGFKLSDGDELNYNFTPTMWLPLPEPKVATSTDLLIAKHGVPPTMVGDHHILVDSRQGLPTAFYIKLEQK